jgi:glutamate formiminotransferase/formiminotetrahydrofolate cyclodeaminase
MPVSLIECVPNFSEARRPEVVDAISAAISAVSGVRILDLHSDLDHNRTVITFVGPPLQIEEAAFLAIEKAAELIDLDQHTGEHPRIGATDVVPFIPISGASIEDCVEIARRLGKRVGDQLDIPVYLYEAAAMQPNRRNLENIRRGEYEAIKQDISADPDRNPDFGPQRVGPAGATVIGARPFLIAYNVYLTTDDVSIAEQIARDIRHSSAGLRFVKALGLLVDGRAQVSMNLTNFRKTPIARVVELIRREAARHGTAIHHSELVGLIPQEALEDAAVWYLQLDQFETDQVLEKRLYSSIQDIPSTSGPSGEPDVEAGDFLSQLALGTPTPGGGSASAYAAAMAAALVLMVARLTIGKKKYADVEDEMRAIATQVEALQTELQQAVSDDAGAFQAVMESFRLPKDTPEEKALRADRIQEATLYAAQVPLEVASKSIDLLEFTQTLVLKGNLNAISDAGSAAALAGAALNGAALNVRINTSGLKDQQIASELLDKIGKLESREADLQAQIRSQLMQRGGFAAEWSPLVEPDLSLRF